MEIGGHQFLLNEPDGTDCLNAVGFVMGIIGEPDKLLQQIREVAETEDTIAGRLSAFGFKMSINQDRFRRMSKRDIIDLLVIATDKDAAWFDTHRLSGPDLMELIAEVASILPFAGVLPQKGVVAALLVKSLMDTSSEPETSSGNGTDGDQMTSPDAESDGSYIAPSAAPTEESATN